MAQDTFARQVAMSSLDNTNNLDTRLTAVEQSVAASLKRVIVQQLPTEEISTTTIYMVPKSVVKPQQGYNEYMYINNQWEKIGDTEVDLTDYAQKTWVEGKGYITSAALPTKTSDLTNDSGFITGVAWGQITGDMFDQEDLAETVTGILETVEEKSNKLVAGTNVTLGIDEDARVVVNATDTTYTAGNNVSISNGVISATDTTYTAGNAVNITNGTINVKYDSGILLNQSNELYANIDHSSLVFNENGAIKSAIGGSRSSNVVQVWNDTTLPITDIPSEQSGITVFDTLPSGLEGISSGNNTRFRFNWYDAEGNQISGPGAPEANAMLTFNAQYSTETKLFYNCDTTMLGVGPVKFVEIFKADHPDAQFANKCIITTEAKANWSSVYANVAKWKLIRVSEEQIGPYVINTENIPVSSIVSGVNDGTNWTSLTVNGTTKAIPAGGSGSAEVDGYTIFQNAFGEAESVFGAGCSGKEYIVGYAKTEQTITYNTELAMLTPISQRVFSAGMRIRVKALMQRSNQTRWDAWNNSGTLQASGDDLVANMGNVTIRVSNGSWFVTFNGGPWAKVKKFQVYYEDMSSYSMSPGDLISYIPIDNETIQRDAGSLSVQYKTSQFNTGTNGLESKLGYVFGAGSQTETKYQYNSSTDSWVPMSQGNEGGVVTPNTSWWTVDTFTTGSTYQFKWEWSDGSITAQALCQQSQGNTYAQFQITSVVCVGSGYAAWQGNPIQMYITDGNVAYRTAMSAPAINTPITNATIEVPSEECLTPIRADALPAGIPSGADGTYVLKAVKSGSTVTYSWVAE